MIASGVSPSTRVPEQTLPGMRPGDPPIDWKGRCRSSRRSGARPGQEDYGRCRGEARTLQTRVENDKLRLVIDETHRPSWRYALAGGQYTGDAQKLAAASVWFLDVRSAEQRAAELSDRRQAQDRAQVHIRRPAKACSTRSRRNSAAIVHLAYLVSLTGSGHSRVARDIQQPRHVERERRNRLALAQVARDHVPDRLAASRLRPPAPSPRPCSVLPASSGLPFEAHVADARAHRARADRTRTSGRRRAPCRRPAGSTDRD